MKNQKYLNSIVSIMSFILIFIISNVFWIFWNTYYRDMIINPFYEKGSLLLTLVYIIIYYMFCQIYSANKIGYLKVPEIIYSQSLTMIFTNTVAYMQISLLAKKLVNPYYIFIMTFFEIFISIIWSYVCDKIYFRIYPPMSLIMIYSNSNVISLISKLSRYRNKYKISTSINIEEGLDVIFDKVDKYDGVVICDIYSTARNKILKYCFSKNISVYMTPKISDIIVQSSERFHIFDTPLLICKDYTLTIFQKFVKRLMDIILSLTAIILFLPFMIIVAAIIKLYDGGPIIYKQKRLTNNNKVFDIYKFRSMIVDAESNGQVRLATENDKRITPFGMVIRKIRFDELPQLFNILKGDMSIVGPRPERPEISMRYIKSIPEFELRTKVKAGLTGYAQIMGKYNTTPYDKLILDLMYIGNYSLFMDIKLILMTVKILFMTESTEGLDENELFTEVALSDKEDR